MSDLPRLLQVRGMVTLAMSVIKINHWNVHRLFVFLFYTGEWFMMDDSGND